MQCTVLLLSAKITGKNLGVTLTLNWTQGMNFRKMINIQYRIYSYFSFSENSFRNIVRMSNNLDPDQAQQFVELKVDLESLQR